MLTELEGTFYTELPALRWPKHGTNHEEDGQGRQGQARAAARLRATGNGIIDEDM